jgi:hypothetical protein
VNEKKKAALPEELLDGKSKRYPQGKIKYIVEPEMGLCYWQWAVEGKKPGRTGFPICLKSINSYSRH